MAAKPAAISAATGTFPTAPTRPTLWTEAIEPTLPSEAMLAIEPAEAIEAMLPALAMLAIEPAEAMLAIDPAEAIEAMLPALAMLAREPALTTLWVDPALVAVAAVVAAAPRPLALPTELCPLMTASLHLAGRNPRCSASGAASAPRMVSRHAVMAPFPAPVRALTCANTGGSRNLAEQVARGRHMGQDDYYI